MGQIAPIYFGPQIEAPTGCLFGSCTVFSAYYLLLKDFHNALAHYPVQHTASQ
jgi:hypothetical protein